MPSIVRGFDNFDSSRHLPAYTFSEVESLTEDIGPIIVSDMAGKVWTWTESEYFVGYRNPLCGEIPQTFAPIPRYWELPVVGAVWSESDPREKRLIALFREYGYVVPIGSWVKGAVRIADLGDGDWKSPDLQDQFFRMGGTDADTGNERVIGTMQTHKFKNHIHYMSAVSTTTYSGGTSYSAATTDSGTAGVSTMSSPDSGAGVETRPVNTAFHPVIAL